MRGCPGSNSYSCFESGIVRKNYGLVWERDEIDAPPPLSEFGEVPESVVQFMEANGADCLGPKGRRSGAPDRRLSKRLHHSAHGRMLPVLHLDPVR